MLERAEGERTYGQYCPVAAGLDLIGDRWVLLICRELVGAPVGFNQIKRALPGLASNLLSSRLRMMSANGLVTREDGGYTLTDAGRSVIPVLRAVARFGVVALDSEPSQNLDAVRLTRGFVLPWVVAGLLVDPVLIHTEDGSVAQVSAADGGLVVCSAPDADAVTDAVHLHIDAANLVAVRQGKAPFTGRVSGPEGAAERVLRALGLESPTPVV